MPRIPPENVRPTGSTVPPENVGPIVEVPEPEEEVEEPAAPAAPQIFSFTVYVSRPASHDTAMVSLASPRFYMPEAGYVSHVKFHRQLAGPMPGGHDTTWLYPRLRTVDGYSYVDGFELEHDGVVTSGHEDDIVAANSWFAVEFWIYEEREPEDLNLPMNDVITVTVTYSPLPA